MRKESFTESLKENPKLKKRFRILGLILTIIGGLFIIIAIIDFFAAMNSFGGPRLFILFFFGMILLGPGIACLKFGYMGEVARYTATQLAPVKKDTINYMLDGTREEVSKTIKTFRNEIVYCPSCRNEIDKDSSFCNKCGVQLSLKCGKCNSINSSDSKFCKKCGNELR